MSDLKESVAWRGLQTECPSCGEVFDIDEQDLIEGTTCWSCTTEFLPKE